LRGRNDAHPSCLAPMPVQPGCLERLALGGRRVASNLHEHLYICPFREGRIGAIMGIFT
jgi:hypothetical protein